MLISQRIAVATLAIACLTASAHTAMASGFAILEQSARGVGHALAGATAETEDPSTLFFNPAGAAWLDGNQGVIGGHVIIPSFEFENGGSTYPALGGVPVSGGNGGDGGVTTFVPNFYYVQSVNQAVKVGVGISAPWGLETEYDEGWVGRYHALKTELKTIDINPSIAVKLTEKIAIGAGVSAQYADAELSNAIDFGTIAGVAPGMLDGRGTVKGDDWSYGYNVGLMVTPTPKTRLGLHYRSKIEHTLEGDARFRVPAPAMPIQARGLFVDTTGEADLNLPDVLSAGVYQQVGNKLALRADIAWTGWSEFDELRVEYGSNQPDSVTDESWDDTWRYAVGMDYFVNEKWTWRVGAAYDETPVPDADHRTPRIPDADRTWLTTGLGYLLSESASLDFSYAHIFFNDSEMNQITSTGDNLRGRYEGDADIVSLQLKVKI